MKQHEHERFYDMVKDWLRMRGQPVDPRILGMWLVALNHLELDEIEQGIVKAMRDTENGRFPPSPDQVLRHVVRRPEYHVAPERLPDIARGSGMSGILDHLESKQERNSRGAAWIAKMRTDLAKVGKKTAQSYRSGLWTEEAER